MNMCNAPFCRNEATHRMEETIAPHTVYNVCAVHGESYTTDFFLSDKYRMIDDVELLTVDDFFKEL